MCFQIVFHLIVCVGHQPVQSQVQPKHQHDQKVHRSAHRQAVHWAKPDLCGRVQLCGVSKAKEHFYSCTVGRQVSGDRSKKWTRSSSCSGSTQWLKAGLVPLFLKTRNITVSCHTTPPPSFDSSSFSFWSCLQHHQCHARVRSTIKKRQRRYINIYYYDWIKEENQKSYTWELHQWKLHIKNMFSFLTFAVVCLFLFFVLLNVLIKENCCKKPGKLTIASTFKCKEKLVNMFLLLVK